MTHEPMFLVTANLFAAVLFRLVKPNLFSALLLAVVMIASTAYLGTQHAREIMVAIYTARDEVLTYVGKPNSWPPERHRRYPGLELVDQEGNLTKLSDFEGRVLLIEPVGMSCPGCVAFSGGDRRGPFRGTPAQPGLSSIDKYAKEYGDIELNHPNLVFIQILLFNQKMEVPTHEEVVAWARHFGMTTAKNRFVLGGNESLLTEASHGMIPGFQLVDKRFVLRMDSTGDAPKDDLYSRLLPAIKELLDEK